MASPLSADSIRSRNNLRCFLQLILFSFLLISILPLNGQGPNTLSGRKEQIRNLLKLIHQGEQTHMAPGKLGSMWITLGSDYRDALEYELSEKAYIKGLQLLKEASDQDENYAIALDNLSYLYLQMGREREAENTRKAAFMLRKKVGNRLGIARSYEYFAVVYQRRAKFKDAEKYASLAYDEMTALPVPNIGEKIAPLITRAYARCYRGKCTQALEDIQLAHEIANATFHSASLPSGQVLFAEGFIRWRMGNPETGSNYMQQGLAILQDHLAPSSPSLREILFLYQQCLTAAHRNQEANQVAAQIARSIRNQPGQSCPNCTVSIYGLSDSWD